MLPVEVRILPTYEVVAGFGMLDTYVGLTLPLIASATATFLFRRSEEHTSELQSLMRISYAVFCLNKKKTTDPKMLTHNAAVDTVSEVITTYKTTTLIAN